jgi:hypothetical protein
MISMFKNECKPPLTLWIEKKDYNYDHREDDEMGDIFTLNGDEDESPF